MGITIHYKGMIDKNSDVDGLVDKLEDFANVLGWRTKRWSEDGSQSYSVSMKGCHDKIELEGNIPIRGIVLFPHENSEPLTLTFSKEGNLVSWMDMVMLAKGKIDRKASWLSIKTQFAPIEIHIAIIKLLKYLKKSYISNLQVYDEGDYWETGDHRELSLKFERINRAMDMLEENLNQISRLDNKSTNEVADLIEELIRRTFR